MQGPHQPQALPAVHLEIVRGRARCPVRRVEPPAFLIGTAGDCDLVLGDPQFPDAHSYIVCRGKSVTIRHLGDEPEVTLNGRPVLGAPLSDGDRLRMGPYEFRVSITPPSTSGRRRGGPETPDGRDKAAGDIQAGRPTGEMLVSDPAAAETLRIFADPDTPAASRPVAGMQLPHWLRPPSELSPQPPIARRAAVH